MIPPLMSSTMSSEQVLGNKGQADTTKSQTTTGGNKKVISTEEKKAGRTEKPDEQKSEKTIQNKESMS